MSALESSSGLPGKEYAKDAEAESDHHLHVRAACARGSEITAGLRRVGLEAVDAWTLWVNAGNATDRAALLQAVQDLKPAGWHGLPAAYVWSLWTRYACTAFYSHPAAWAEIGFPGPAYPRRYKNAGVGKLEPFEVRAARSAVGPVRSGD